VGDVTPDCLYSTFYGAIYKNIYPVYWEGENTGEHITVVRRQAIYSKFRDGFAGNVVGANPTSFPEKTVSFSIAVVTKGGLYFIEAELNSPFAFVANYLKLRFVYHK
jgi:hypothetical protein